MVFDEKKESDLKSLGLFVNQNYGNVVTCWTKREHLIVVGFKNYEDFGDVYTLETYNASTINCFEKWEDLLECLKNYLK